MNRQEKMKVAVTMALILGIVAFAAFQGMGQAYELGFSDGLGVNKTDGPSIYGHLTISVMDGDVESSSWEVIWSHSNLITNVGRNQTRDQIGGTAGNPFKYIAIGTGSGQTAASEALATQFSTRGDGTYSDTAVAYNWTITYTFTAGFFDGEAITEAGVFNAAADGIMFNYQDFTAITLSSTDSLQVQFEFMITDAG